MENGITYYRNHELVLLDPRTGKELLTVRDSVLHATPVAAISSDGRYVAVATAPVGATWGGEPARVAARYLQVWDLRAHRRLYAGTPAPLRPKLKQDSGLTVLCWSATGRYLALGIGWADKVVSDLYLMPRDGRGPTVALPGPPEQWVWDHQRDVLYAPMNGSVSRVRPEAIPTASPGAANPSSVGQVEAGGLSPDGRWLVFSTWAARGEDDPRPASAPAALRLVAAGTEGGAYRTLWEQPGSWTFSFAWRAGTLYVLATRQERSVKDTVTSAELLRWRPG